tara:strand:- start:63 stop:371 length:309 start_codon:yes stop_codon:yes gene_type:complete
MTRNISNLLGSKKPGHYFGVLILIMNAILSICSEYSDNVWYSGFGVDSVPTRIAIEIERKYRFAFLKLMARHGFTLEKTKRGDDHVCVLTLAKAEHTILADL